MIRALFITHFGPSDVGHGGHHRDYQILYDMEQAFGAGSVRVISYREWAAGQPPVSRPSLKQRISGGIWRRLSGLTENPARFITRKAIYSPHRFGRKEFLAYYEQQLHRTERPAIAVLCHTGFADLITINQRYGIVTICCPHNLEAFDNATGEKDGRGATLARQIDFANELAVLRRCNERLFISRVEAGLVGGLGLAACYYPYLPVGRIRERCLEIRQQRKQSRGEPGLFLIVGSASHTTAHQSLTWFVNQVRHNGLPPGVRIVVAGSKTDTLLPRGITLPGLELRGWVEQAELDKLMIHSQAVLVPQKSGFGALTRLPEYACAGIACLTSVHPTYAQNMLPGVVAVEDTWPAWQQAMQGAVDRTISTTLDDYLTWEQQQPAPLTRLLAHA